MRDTKFSTVVRTDAITGESEHGGIAFEMRKDARYMFKEYL